MADCYQSLLRERSELEERLKKLEVEIEKAKEEVPNLHGIMKELQAKLSIVPSWRVGKYTLAPRFQVCQVDVDHIDYSILGAVSGPYRATITCYLYVSEAK